MTQCVAHRPSPGMPFVSGGSITLAVSLSPCRNWTAFVTCKRAGAHGAAPTVPFNAASYESILLLYTVHLPLMTTARVRRVWHAQKRVVSLPHSSPFGMLVSVLTSRNTGGVRTGA
jgi:hypothetical protein